MRARELLAEAMTPAGAPLTLTREAGALVVRVGGALLMSSRVHGSEEAMADVACAPLRERPGARVLVGGLGMGFTLRAALDALAPDAGVVVAELLPSLVAWNRGPLGPLARDPLSDPRVTLTVGDVANALAGGPFDAILLDVDNGPEALTVPDNARLYGREGVRALRSALRPGGALVVWSASESPRFTARLREGGLEVEVVRVRARGAVKKGARHVLHVGRRPS